MSKIIEKYNELKGLDKEKLYLFKSGWQTNVLMI